MKVSYKITNHREETVDLTLTDIVKYTHKFPNIKVHYRQYKMVGDFYNIDITREETDSFTKIKLNTLTKYIDAPTSCLDILRAGDQKGNEKVSNYKRFIFLLNPHRS